MTSLNELYREIKILSNKIKLLEGGGYIDSIKYAKQSEGNDAGQNYISGDKGNNLAVNSIFRISNCPISIICIQTTKGTSVINSSDTPIGNVVNTVVRAENYNYDLLINQKNIEIPYCFYTDMFNKVYLDSITLHNAQQFPNSGINIITSDRDYHITYLDKALQRKLYLGNANPGSIYQLLAGLIYTIVAYLPTSDIKHDDFTINISADNVNIYNLFTFQPRDFTVDKPPLDQVIGSLPQAMLKDKDKYINSGMYYYLIAYGDGIKNYSALSTYDNVKKAITSIASTGFDKTNLALLVFNENNLEIQISKTPCTIAQFRTAFATAQSVNDIPGLKF